ncbi:MAG: glucose 1-dehydrogenase [bacterium]|nr:glucose 1-dehydrogenase [bacterium]
MAQFANKVALVVGGTLGIGERTAVELAAEGAHVVVAGRSAEHGQRTVDLIRGQGGSVSYHPVDVQERDQVQALVQYTVAAHGRLDYLVQSAGLEGAVANTVECTDENWAAVMNTNVTGTWYCMRYAIPEMLRNGGGAIVNVASIIGWIAFPGLPAYTASKAATIALTKTTALEYAKQNIRVNVVCPGSIRTPMYNRFSGGTPEAEAYMATFHPIGRIGEPPEVSSAILWLLSDGASFVTGHVLPVAGGWEVP